MPLIKIQEFLRLETASGIILIAATGLALLFANSFLVDLYQALLDTPVHIRVGKLDVSKPLLLWINDGLMTVFFLLVGLEVKREIVQGELSQPSQVVLPTLAAIGGMVVPALIYVGFNAGDAEALSGWAIPAATDIAFALGVLALLGNRAPASLKIFLMSVAIIDDLGAIVIIALFYSGDLSLVSLGLAAAGVVVLVLLNLFGVTRLAAYVLTGIFLWVAVLKSGVHATLAGVAIAFAIPLRDKQGNPSQLVGMEHALHPWVMFAILPVFVFANAGVSLQGLGLESLLRPVPLGIAAGLFLGKQVGVFGVSWLAIKLGLARLPDQSTMLQLYGVALLCGIGFTMSLFIGSLAFEHGGPDYASDVRIGVLAGSILSGLTGYMLMRLGSKKVSPG